MSDFALFWEGANSVFTLCINLLRYSENSLFWRLQEMCCGMFCLDGEIIFIHSIQVNITGCITLILVLTRGYIREYLRGVVESVNPKFASSDRKISFLETIMFFLITWGYHWDGGPFIFWFIGINLSIQKRNISSQDTSLSTKVITTIFHIGEYSPTPSLLQSLSPFYFYQPSIFFIITSVRMVFWPYWREVG